QITQRGGAEQCVGGGVGGHVPVGVAGQRRLVREVQTSQGQSGSAVGDEGVHVHPDACTGQCHRSSFNVCALRVPSPCPAGGALCSAGGITPARQAAARRSPGRAD